MKTATGGVRRRKHKKVLASTKGYRMTKNRLYRVAHEASMHAGQYSYAHRKRRLGQFRRIWITRLTAGASNNGMKYNQLLSALKKNNITINRKLLSEIAYQYPELFSKFIKSF